MNLEGIARRLAVLSEEMRRIDSPEELRQLLELVEGFEYSLFKVQQSHPFLKEERGPLCKSEQPQEGPPPARLTRSRVRRQRQNII